MNAVTLEPDDCLKEAITMSFRHTFACIQIMSTNYVTEAKNCFCGNLRQEAQKQQRNNKYENKNAQSIK